MSSPSCISCSPPRTSPGHTSWSVTPS
jgi:hypothetical protein